MQAIDTAALSDLNLVTQVHRYLPEEIRTGIEQNYYAQVEAQARLERLAHDAEFLGNPATHVALYSDHGRVHARDVAKQIIRVLDIIHGVLVPRRSASRLEFMKGYGVMAAYLHDIGLRDFSSFGREMHPEFATQEVFSPAFDGWIETLWNENWGNLAWRLKNLKSQGALTHNPKVVLREMLSMVNCHSKSKVPVEVLNDPAALRQNMQLALGMNLRSLYYQQQKEKAWHELLHATQAQEDQMAINALASRLREAEEGFDEQESSPDPARSMNLTAHQYYSDFERDAFAWLVSRHEAVGALIDDVVDTLRALRCADALRQRGTKLKTSAGYQVFIDRITANAIYALQQEDGRTFLLEIDSKLGAGEANVAGSELTPEGDIRIAFHRGSFPAPKTVQRAALCAAIVVNDVQKDVIESFRRPADSGALVESLKTAPDMKILLESVDDNLEFADQVCQQLAVLNPQLASRARAVPSLQSVPEDERSRYLSADEIDWDLESRRHVLEEMANSGHKTQEIDLIQAFLDVRCSHLKAGEVLVSAGESSGFVYVPMAEGLKGDPLGGYPPFSVHAWVPLTTGVIRGDVRNATIKAERDLSVLIIPRDVYLRQWHRTYTLKEFTQLLLQA